MPGRSWATAAVVVAATVFSLGLGYYQVLGLHGMYAVDGYDDGVWFGSAVRLAHGILPYRSFVMDQPPGVPLLMTPFGWASRVVGTRAAFGAARLVVPLTEAVTVVAAARLVRHRGLLSVAVACGVVAVYPEALIDQATVMLEPFCAMFCMLGLVAVFSGDRISDRRLAAAGVAFGLAGACKAFAVLPLAVVVVAVLAGRSRLRRLAALGGGVAVAVAVVCGPFVALAPEQFVHQVVAAQLVRSKTVDPEVLARVASLVGLLPATLGLSPDASQAAGALLAVVVVAAVVAGLVVAPRPPIVEGLAAEGRSEVTAGRRWIRRRRRARAPGRGTVTPLDGVVAAAAAVTAIGLARPPSYYEHYAAFFAPFLAVVVGLAAGNLARRLPRVVAVVAVVALAAGGIYAVVAVQARGASAYDAAPIDALIPPGACVVSDDPSTLLLTDRFTSSVADCPKLVDAFGTTISSDRGAAPESARAARSPAVAVWESAFGRAQYLVLVWRFHSVRIPWRGQLLPYVERNFVAVGHDPTDLVLRRRTRHAALRPAG
jgi:alpha-1,2-mannosyltransferase